MVLLSSQVQQQIYAQHLAYTQMGHQAQGLMMPQMSLFAATQQAAGGIYGEQAAMGAASAGRTMMGIGSMGLGVAGAMTGMPLDPFSAAMSVGRMGWRAGGLAGGIAGAAMGALPFYAASQVAGAYGGAFTGGMRDQASLNSTLRGNFNFIGGGGAFGRGFSQNQMGQIGGMVQQELRQNPFTSSGEINQLIGQGSESGMFTAVRDVQQFGSRFRQMLDGLKKIQKELGGTLSDAMTFTRGSQQLGIYSTAGRTQFAAEMRDAQATTGMDQNQLFSLAAQGSMLSRATGGFGRQGAIGALRTARTLGSAVSTGAVNSELLSEATGGLQGAEAVQAFTTRMMQQTERFSHRGMGRFSLFAMSNKDATGLDAGMRDRFLAGDISTSEVSQTAHRNVNRMGRARAVNREGMLRGSMLEEGGLAGQIGMMKLMVGDRVMDQSDDMASLVLQRRFGMGRSESQVMMGLMRNQGGIAQQELADKASGRYQTSLTQDIRENRSVEAFMGHLQHGLQDAAGVTKAKELGASFMTKMSSMVERAMNDFLGIQATALSSKDTQAIQRLAMGQASSADIDRLRTTGGTGGSSVGDPYAKSLATQSLEALGLHGARTVGETMEARGVAFRSMSIKERGDAVRSAEMAQLGVVYGKDKDQLGGLLGNESDTMRRLGIARFGGGMAEAYKEFGGSASSNAVDAFMKQKGMSMGDLAPNASSLALQGGGQLQGALGRILAQGAQGLVAGGIAGTLGGGPIGTAVGGVLGGIGFAGLEAMRALESPQDKALEFISRGGHVAGRAQALVDRFGTGRAGQGTGLATEAAKAAGMSIREAENITKGFGDGVDKDALKAVLGGETFQSSMRRIRGYQGDAGAQKNVLAELERDVSKMDPASKEGKAAQAALIQMRSNLRSKAEGGIGALGNEFQISSGDDRRSREIRGRMDDMGSKYGVALRAMGADTEIGKMLGGIQDKFHSYDAAGVGSSISELQSKLSGMDPNSQEYRSIAEALGSTEETRGLLMGASTERNTVKQLTGKGRRGRAAQAESALGLLTGGSLSEMDLTMGGRSLSKRNQASVVFDQFAKGGAGADELSEQIGNRLREMGVKDVESKINLLRTSAKDGVTGEEASKLYKSLGNDEELKRIQTEGTQRMQQQQDPLGTQRNDLLKSILDGINIMAKKEPGEPMSSPDR